MAERFCVFEWQMAELDGLWIFFTKNYLDSDPIDFGACHITTLDIN